MATRDEIELTVSSSFDYPYLYQPARIINGHKESSVCIVTSEAPKRIQFGIWGVLPNGYKDAWKSFQSLHNTLEIERDSIPETSWLFEALKYRRCLIVATGFFSSEIKNHKLYSSLNYLKDHKVFCFAGIYNVCEDGFITCSILTHSNESSHYHLKNSKPIIIARENYDHFLKKNLEMDDFNAPRFELSKNEFEQQPIINQNYWQKQEKRNSLR